MGKEAEMSEKEEIRLNRLPAITWYWLNMNESEITSEPCDGEAEVSVSVPDGVTESRVRLSENKEVEDLSTQPTGAGAAFSKIFDTAGTEARLYTVPAGLKADKPLKLQFAFADGKNSLDQVALDVQKNAELTLVMDYASDEAASGAAAVQTKFRLGENAVLRIVQITHVGSDFSFVNDMGGKTADNARVEVIQLNLEGQKVYQGYQIDLAGYKSSLKTDIAYRLKGTENLDMNYFANHTGRKTTCDINVSGVLRDTSSKVLRATIDLKKGAKEAVGNEKEDVLLMDEGVRNRTIPLILCTEEDVEGNHGATIGRLDESLMFYLASRGLNREEIYEMMAAARMEAVAAKIPDEETRADVEKYIGTVSED